MTDRTMFGWRKVARILASERDTTLLEAMGIRLPSGPTQAWARGLLDGVEDFWEVDDVEADGGQAVRDLERDLEGLAGPDAMKGLAEAASVLSRPLGDTENLDHWQMLLDSLSRDQDILVTVPGGLHERVRGVLGDVGWPYSPQIWTRPGESIEDAWEWNFWSEHPEIEPDVIADEVIGLRHTERALRRLSEALTDHERAALERWANAEEAARLGEPRPAHWPPRPPLALS